MNISDPYSVRVTSGILITCDTAAKQILLHLDTNMDGATKFVLRDVDDTHLLIKTESLKWAQNTLQEELEKNTYVPVDESKTGNKD